MKTSWIALAGLFAAWPAWSDDRLPFDLGFAHVGMDLTQFRDASWPDGVRVWCSADSDQPGEVNFDLPRGAERLRVRMCGLFAQDGSGQWKRTPLTLAGWPGKVSAVFFPDRTGTPRLAQLTLSLPPQAFDDLARDWDGQFGLPNRRLDHLVGWSTPAVDAVIIDDGSVYMHAYLLDNDRQAEINRRMSQRPAQH